MITISAKTLALAAILSFSALMSGSAHAAILHSSSGAPVMTSGGACVTTGFDGGADCMTAKTEAAAPKQETVDMTPTKKVAREETTVYFDFNKSTLTAEAKHRLDHLAHHLTMAGGHHHRHHLKAGQNVVIVGFADRVGKAEYNEKLALKRAQTVRDYLVSKGVKADKVEVHSLGKSTPSAQCSAKLPHAKLVSCLREDRRVEIEFNGCAK